jgi:LysR family transcriptional regulator, transcription activator of glutamate synthase operon
MDVHHLRYFEAVARLGHVTRAAQELHIAQPSLSKQIQTLEGELGVALFNRVGRRIELTDAGALLLPYARRILRDVEAAQEALQQRADLHHGRVSIGAPPTVGTHLLPQALADWNARYNAIQLELHEAGAGELVELLAEGAVDLAVVPGPVRDVTWIELFTEELVVAVGSQHPLAQYEGVTANDVRAHGFILFPAGYELRDRTLAYCRSAGFEPRVVLDGGEMDTVLRLTAVGLGIAIMPRLALQGADGVIGIPIRDAQLHRTLGLIRHPERTLSPAAAALSQFLLHRLQADQPHP